MKISKRLLTSLLLVAIISSCNLPNKLSLPTQTTTQNLAGTIVAMTLMSNPTQTQVAIIAPTFTVPTVNTIATPTRIPPNTPVWSVYTYTCELASGGGTMTMNLDWTDRSSSEEGYKVYRGEKVIATLAPNSTFYVDTAFVATGKTLSYTVEAFNANWRVSTSTITFGCQ
jgi:hypothetical protein